VSILLDTDLLSLLGRKRNPAKLAAWMAEQNDLVISGIAGWNGNMPTRCRRGVVECIWITDKYVIMSAAQFIHELEAMSKSERESIFASLVENQEWREDLLDLMTIADRRNEPVRPIDEVFSDLKIDAWSGASSLRVLPKKNWQSFQVKLGSE
jgi:hypothetical protein